MLDPPTSRAVRRRAEGLAAATTSSQAKKRQIASASTAKRPRPLTRVGSARFDLARQPQPALRDDVLLDLRRPAADDEAEREHVVGRPDAGVANARVLLREPA